MTNESFQTNRHNARPRKREPSTLITIAGQVRSIALTREGYVSCVVDGPAGRLRALSDATTIHLPELRPGRRIRAVLLRMQRETGEGRWQWRLLAAQGEEVRGDLVSFPTRTGSAA